MNQFRIHGFQKANIALGLIATLAAILACSLPRTTIGERNASIPTADTHQDAAEFFPRPTEGPYADFSFLPVLREPGEPVPTPTPDPERTLPPIRKSYVTYYVRYADTLGKISLRYGVSVDEIIAENGITDPNLLAVGQALNIPPPTPTDLAPGLKLIPDSELVNGPYNAKIDIIAYIQSKGGYINQYEEKINDIPMSGPEIVQMVATNYSVNPRLLLVILEYQSGWLTRPEDEISEFVYPMGMEDEWRKGLYYQLAWAANALNSGFYRWRVNAMAGYPTADGKLIPANPGINAGTAALQNLFAAVQPEDIWRQTVSPNGFIRTYQQLYGHPFDWTVEPLVPAGLTQPELQLPFEPGERWIFTGGPHGGWDGGSAWSAVDFAPPKDQFGCIQNDEWVVAMADGLIVRSGEGAVIQDLDGDGHEETGWVLFYMHIETRDRVEVGSYLKAGERIGHPSCEGGVSTGTHVHLARRYNGEWIAINSPIPFVMDGWTIVDDGILYGGYLEKDGQIIYPCQCKDEENKIERPQ